MRSRGFALILSGALLTSAGCTDATDATGVAAAESRARALASAPASPQAASAAPAAPSAASSTAPAGAATAAPSRKPGARSGKRFAKRWAQYPWPSSSWPNCSAPDTSPGVKRNPAKPGVVVVVGDSLIREARTKLTAELGKVGYQPVYVCAGGKTLKWGQEQLSTMQGLGLNPRCLVYNLGTNDLKGTTEQGLRDAVSLAVTGRRLRTLLAASADVERVLVVDIAANTALAPSTMSDVAAAPGVYREVVSRTGNAALVPWSRQTLRHPEFIGPDGVHDTAAGSQRRAAVITDRVARQCGPST